MNSSNWFKENLFKVSQQNFSEFALKLFKYQTANNPVYSKYMDAIGVNPSRVNSFMDIPYMPIEFFKTQTIKCGTWKDESIFQSSGTTKTGRSIHHIRDLEFYKNLSCKIFEMMVGKPSKFKILALLPSYLEQENSSLVCMVDNLITFGKPGSVYILNDTKGLHKELVQETPTTVFGVSYALLEVIESNSFSTSLEHVTLIETGGMKGRKKEITRRELHEQLKLGFPGARLFTEYGMTELLSQAYGRNGFVRFPVWVKPLIRNLNDPFKVQLSGSGALNLIDLANVDTCAFIETKDLGNARESGEFEVLGRIDNSDIRGCNLLFS